jgi:hypothetical protein
LISGNEIRNMQKTFLGVVIYSPSTPPTMRDVILADFLIPGLNSTQIVLRSDILRLEILSV